ncbi:MAG: NfeD family protein, partial [Bdellovibrionota bacterium]
GILGIGGLVALGLGSFLLYDPSITGFRLPLSMIFAVVGSLGAIMLGILYLLMKTMKLGAAKSDVALIGRTGKIMKLNRPSLRKGMIQVLGENWHFESDVDVEVGSKAVVVSQENLTLRIKPEIG